MKNILNKIPFLFILILFSCTFKQKELSLSESDFIIDLDGKKELFIPFSEYFKTLRTIILETGNDCMIGRVTELQVFDGYIYVLDGSFAKSLFVFDMNGRFVRKIGNIGEGPGEFLRPDDFTIDTENRFIFLLDNAQRIHKYHFNGTFVQTITPQVQKAHIYFIQYFKSKLYLSIRAYQPTPEDNMLFVADPVDGKILSSFLSLKYNKGWSKPFTTGHSFFMSRLNAPPRYTQLFMDCIVTIGEDITPYIELKSKNLSTDEDFKIFGDGGMTPRFDTAIMQFTKVWNVRNFIESDDFIIFRYRHGYSNFYTVTYNKKTKAVKIANYLNNNLIFKNDKDDIYRTFVFSDKKGAYEILDTRIINRFQESIRNNETVPELDKEDELLKLDGESNPVIFYYEFK